MSGMVPVPKSQLDPYTPEKSDEKPVKLRLFCADGSVIERVDGKRVLTRPRVPLRVEGHVFLYRATEGDGTHVYRELPVLDLDKVRLSELQAEYVSLTEKISNPVMQDGFGVKKGVTSAEHGALVCRRLEIVFRLVEDEITRVSPAALKR